MLLHAILVVELQSVERPPTGFVGLHSLDEGIDRFIFDSSHQSRVLLKLGVEEDDGWQIFRVDLKWGDELGVALCVKGTNSLIDLCCDPLGTVDKNCIC